MPGHNGNGNGKHPGALSGSEIRVICIYPTIHAGKLARQWIETALASTMPRAHFQIEYFNYEVISHNGISWEHVCGRLKPDIILIVGDGDHPLDAGLRHSLRELFSLNHREKNPLVLFRDLEPEPSLNTRTILDYVSVLSLKNHCELKAMNGNGTPISCFRNPRLLLKTRQYHE